MNICFCPLSLGLPRRGKDHCNLYYIACGQLRALDINTGSNANSSTVKVNDLEHYLIFPNYKMQTRMLFYFIVMNIKYKKYFKSVNLVVVYMNDLINSCDRSTGRAECKHYKPLQLELPF